MDSTKRNQKGQFVSVAFVGCLWLLMVFTFSPPEDWKASNFGTATLLSPTLTKLLKLGARLGSLGILTLLLFQNAGRKNAGRNLLVCLPMIAFLGWSLASAFWSPLRSVSVQQAVSFGIIVLLSLVAAVCWQSPRDSERWFCHVVWILLILCTGLLILHFAAPKYGALTKEASGLLHSTTAGACASLGLILITASYAVYRWNWATFLILPAFPVFSATMLVGGNRFSIILAVLIVALVVLIFLERLELSLGILAFGIIGFGYLLFDPGLHVTDKAVAEVEEYVKQGQTSVQLKSVSGRSEMWDTIWKSSKQSIWIGHGYFVTSKTGRLFVWGEWGNWTAHNVYLQLLVTLGIVGSILFFIAIALPVAFVCTVAVDSHHERCREARFLLLLWLWFGLWGLLNATIIGPIQPESVVFGILYGLSTNLAARQWLKWMAYEREVASNLESA